MRACAKTSFSRANVELPNEYVDNSVQWFVNKHLDWPRARLEFSLNRLLYRQTELHELGHCLGLRHDFGASADSDALRPEYYEIAARYPLPDPTTSTSDGKAGCARTSKLAFESAVRRGAQGPRAGRHRRRDELVGDGVHLQLVRAPAAARPLRQRRASRSATATWSRPTTDRRARTRRARRSALLPRRRGLRDRRRLRVLGATARARRCCSRATGARG